MKSLTFRCYLRISVGLLSLALFAPPGTAQVYTITDLGTFATGTYSAATGINNLGQVSGSADLLNSYSHRAVHAFLWTKKAGMQDLGTFPDGGETFFSSWATAVNSLGRVAGGSWYDLKVNHGFLWSQAGGMQDLEKPVGLGGGSNAQSINVFGEVVGTAYETPGGGAPHAFCWTRNGGMQILENLPGAQYSHAYGINDFGQVTGIAQVGDTSHTFLQTKRGGMVDLGNWNATAINNLGQIAGDNGHAVLWSTKQGIRDLGTLPGGNNSAAAAVNDFGQVVGWSTSSKDPFNAHAVLWSKYSGTWDLNDLISPDSGWVLYNATGINVWGQIVGNGMIGGQTHAFLLTPNLGSR